MKRQVVSEQILRKLALNQELRRKIPFLSELTTKTMKQGGGCRSCRKKVDLTAIDVERLQEVKKRLYRSPSEIRQLVKNHLQVDHLIFYFEGIPGYPQRATV